MRVFIVARGYPTDKYKMNGIFEFDQAKALARAGVDVVYAAVDVRSLRRWRKWGFEEKTIEGVRVYAVNIPCGRVPKRLLRLISVITLRRLFSRIVKKYGRPDIVHSHFINQGYFTVSALKKEGVPIVHTEHYSGMNKTTLDGYSRFMGEHTYKEADKVIAVSRFVAKNIQGNFGVEHVVLPKINYTTVFDYSPCHCLGDEFRFVSAGNLVEGKRMDLLISAFHKAFANKPKVKLYIYGDGPERNNLERMIDHLDLSLRVLLMGLVDRRTIARKMNESHCFVLASQLETFGVVLIEALSCGLPVIATTCGGPEDFIDNNNGIIVPTNNAECLADAMKSMHLSINQYNRPSIASDTKAKFSPQSVAMKIIGVYEEILEMRKRE